MSSNLSDATLRELEAFANSLQREVEKLQARVDAIHTVLGQQTRLTQAAVEHTVRTYGELGRTVADIASNTVALVGHGAVGAPSISLRKIVQEKLRAHPGWKAADVTRALRAEGYERTGKTRFSHRIYNEVWRMEKDGLVTRDENGGFVVTD